MAALKAAKAGRTWQANSETLQLLLIVSDGRILGEQQPVERLVRDAANEGVLPVLVLLDHFAPPGSAAAGAAAGTAAGGGGAGVSTVPAHSILDIQSTAFVSGKVKMTRYMDSYPLPYYIVLRDMHALPSYLGDALRQWFELVANRNA